MKQLIIEFPQADPQNNNRHLEILNNTSPEGNYQTTNKLTHYGIARCVSCGACMAIENTHCPFCNKDVLVTKHVEPINAKSSKKSNR